MRAQISTFYSSSSPRRWKKIVRVAWSFRTFTIVHSGRIQHNHSIGDCLWRERFGNNCFWWRDGLKIFMNVRWFLHNGFYQLLKFGIGFQFFKLLGIKHPNIEKAWIFCFNRLLIANFKFLWGVWHLAIFDVIWMKYLVLLDSFRPLRLWLRIHMIFSHFNTSFWFDLYMVGCRLILKKWSCKLIAICLWHGWIDEIPQLLCSFASSSIYMCWLWLCQNWRRMLRGLG